MNYALILSGGVGTRIRSEVPKQYIEIEGKMILTHCLEAVISCKEIDGVWIVAADEWRKKISAEIRASEQLKSVFGAKGRFPDFSAPGKTRQLSILNGLEDIRREAGEEDIVLVHDAARPLVTSELLKACLEACREHDGAMPALPMKDTVYLSEDGNSISQLLDRSKVVAGQAPEAFRLGKYYEAVKQLLPDRIYQINGASEPAVMAGMDIAVIPGDENNFKITTETDLQRYREIIRKNPERN